VAKDLEPQLTDEDLELIRDTRADFHAVRAVPVTIKTMVVAGVDPHTDEPIGTVTETTLSGVVQVLSEEDRLLRLGGRIRVGDLKLTLLYDDAIAVSLEALREARIALAGSPENYVVDVMDVQGLGLRNRVELGLVLG
jgi:hypothetical protein